MKKSNLLLAILILALTGRTSAQQIGDGDQAFGGGDGIVMTDFGSTMDEAYAVALQSDGKIIAAGHSGSDFALVRYNIDGTLNNSFGNNGKVTTSLNLNGDVATSLLIQPDGKIFSSRNY